MELSKYIKDILISRDNVIIPNFGAFEKTMLSARIDSKTGEMHPPQNGVVFRSDLKTDSGILIKYIAEKESISEEKALEEIQGQVAIWEDALNQGQQILLIGIGTLVKDSSGILIFESTITAADFPETFGLPVINIQEKSTIGKTVEKKKEEVKKEEVKPEKKKEEIKKAPIKQQKETVIRSTEDSNKSHKKLIVALFIAVPIVALIVLGALNFDFVKQKMNDTSHFVGSIFKKNNQSDTLKTASELDSIKMKDSVDNETKTILENYTIIDESTNTKVAIEANDLQTFKKVYVISGSFKSKSFANRQSKILNKKGFKAEVLPENKGLFRVSVASFDNVDSAAKDFERIKAMDESLNFWILVNK